MRLKTGFKSDKTARWVDMQRDRIPIIRWINTKSSRSRRRFSTGRWQLVDLKHKTKPPRFSHLLWHSANKRGGHEWTGNCFQGKNNNLLQTMICSVKKFFKIYQKYHILLITHMKFMHIPGRSAVLPMPLHSPALNYGTSGMLLTAWSSPQSSCCVAYDTHRS